MSFPSRQTRVSFLVLAVGWGLSSAAAQTPYPRYEDPYYGRGDTALDPYHGRGYSTRDPSHPGYGDPYRSRGGLPGYERGYLPPSQPPYGDPYLPPPRPEPRGYRDAYRPA
jgi:hypothetical protein